jgi:hypothetical protein
MKRKWVAIGVCALLTVVLMLVNANSRKNRPKINLEVGPDGTIAVPRNDNMKIVAEVSRERTNSTSAGQ